MPKAPSASTGPRPALRRNQACRSCRKRKLKCDAARPHCGTCVKHWQSIISVPAPVGYAHPTEPQCIYDPVDGLNLAPDTDPVEKIRLLEEEVSRLKAQLQEQSLSSHYSGPSTSHQYSHRPESHSSSSASGSQLSATTGHYPPDHNTGNTPLSTHDHLLQINPGPNNSSRRYSSDNDLELIHTGWNTDLPEPHTLDHYIEVFFRCDPCGPRILHRSSFLAAMRLHPRDPGFPHSAILHAICACASRWSSRKVALQPDGTRKDGFAEYHVGKTRQFIDRTMATGQDIFQVVQACVILSWYFYQEAIPLRLNFPGTFSTHGDALSGGYLPPPRDFRDLESRRRTWWMSIILDRIVSAGGWVHSIDERDIGTELPLRAEDFDAEQLIPNNPQDMCTEDVFKTHLPKYTDSFLLFIKAVMIFGRVTDYNARTKLRAPTAPSKHQDPFVLPGFTELDRLVHNDFIQNLPHMHRFNLGVTDLSGDGPSVDTDLYMVHIIPHAAIITLHNPYLDLHDFRRVSTNRCMKAAQAILSAYYMLSATSLDITRLHPFVTICWYLAAAVQVQVCKYFIEVGDHAREAQIWGEIDVLREAMLNYGTRSPIGTRQEGLLRSLMKEAVRLSSREQASERGLPLYPFSRTTLFANHNITDTAAPLPNPSGPEQDEAEFQDVIGMNLAAPVAPLASLYLDSPSFAGLQDGPVIPDNDFTTWNNSG